MADTNFTALSGTTVSEAEVRDLAGGKKVANIRMATSVSKKTESGFEKTSDFHNITTYGYEAEKLIGVPKGTPIAIHGMNKTDSWEAQDGTKKYKSYVLANSVMIGVKRSQTAPTLQKTPNLGAGNISLEDIPF